MAFTISAPKTFQIHYLDGYLCDQELNIDLIYAVDSVRQDVNGIANALLSVRFDDQSKIQVGEYPVVLSPDKTGSWTEQAEEQIMALEEFAGAVVL
ncbi:hypothetical protein [Klebsiella aerogenes]|uniref:hypothetical protein n=1 Tax=Klebsiella aerogenes TaxID=548 RepID=UPI00292E1947|nr:hypothetical protein [Klebsiella aerogenes]